MAALRHGGGVVDGQATQDHAVVVDLFGGDQAAARVPRCVGPGGRTTARLRLRAGRAGAQPLQGELRKGGALDDGARHRDLDTVGHGALGTARPCSTTRTTAGGAKSPDRSHVHVAVPPGTRPLDAQRVAPHRARPVAGVVDARLPRRRRRSSGQQ